jgi:hypothetical protein
MGRELYLQKLVESIILNLDNNIELEHHICFQGALPSEELEEYLDCFKHIQLHVWPQNIGIAEGMNKIIPRLSGDLICKFDDDCLIHSRNFFKHVDEIHRIHSDLVFSPYPIGLINNPGGVLSKNHEVRYGDIMNTYYTFRYVGHIGGFARIAPAKLVKNWNFSPDLIPGMSGTEDGQHSSLCQQNGIRMAYLENAIVVEHQESTLGQHERYKNYFGERF